MSSIEPYRCHRVVRSIRIRDLARQNEALGGSAAQKEAAPPWVPGPTVALFGKKLVAEPFQSHEAALALGCLESIE